MFYMQSRDESIQFLIVENQFQPYTITQKLKSSVSRTVAKHKDKNKHCRKRCLI